MARCGGCGSGDGCACLIRGAGGIRVSGAGTAQNPYIISSDALLDVESTSTIDLTLAGDGSATDPYTLRADLTAMLENLSDVSLSNTATGNVLARQADGTYDLVPPATATPGAINVGNGLLGDGSSGDPLRVQAAAGGGLVVTAAGVALQGGTAWTTYSPTMYRSSGGTVNIGNSVLTGKYRKSGRTVDLRIELLVGSTFVVGSGAYQFSLPPGAASLTTSDQAIHVHGVLAGEGEYMGSAKMEGDGRITRFYLQRGSALQRCGSTFPAWVQGSKIIIQGTYESQT